MTTLVASSSSGGGVGGRGGPPTPPAPSAVADGVLPARLSALALPRPSTAPACGVPAGGGRVEPVPGDVAAGAAPALPPPAHGFTVDASRSSSEGRGAGSAVSGDVICPSTGKTMCGARCVCQRQRKMRRPEVTARSSPDEWNAMHDTTKSKLSTRTQRSVCKSQMRTVSSSEPEASVWRSSGWNLIVHGVRRWPLRVHTSPHVEHRNTFTVWSP
mmetsp:Transcript_28938/g.74375  ORF Transcript_28938/g.74375 Transcript_28938/m.74375 type:complete len:215 (+) Transcript_28938:1324-1968(+)